MKYLISVLLILISNFSFAGNIQVQNKISKVQSKFGGKIGIYTIDRNNWKNFEYNGNFQFPICSVFKFLVVGAILKESMTNPDLLDKKIKINEGDIIGYTPVTSKNINKSLSVKDLSKAAILSDNTATNLLINELGGLKKLNEFIISLNDKDTVITANEPNVNNINLHDNFNKTSPKSIARDINKIAFSDDVLDKRHQKLFRKWLKENDTGKNRIAYSLPEGWQIGDKTGTCEYGSTNDVAILWPKGKKAIIMSILYTQADKNAKPKDEIIQATSKIVLDYITSQEYE